MARSPFNRDRAARVVVEATLSGTRATCLKYGISERTLKRWRARVASGDTELARAVTEKKALVDADWAEELPGAIRGAITFLQRAGAEADPKDPDAIHSVAGALKILTDVTMSRRILDLKLQKAADARVPPEARATGTPHREGTASGDAASDVH